MKRTFRVIYGVSEGFLTKETRKVVGKPRWGMGSGVGSTKTITFVQRFPESLDRSQRLEDKYSKVGEFDL